MKRALVGPAIAGRACPSRPAMAGPAKLRSLRNSGGPHPGVERKDDSAYHGKEKGGETRTMEQIYYTQCPMGYGLGASNGFQIKRLSARYPLTGDFRHLGLRAFVAGTAHPGPTDLAISPRRGRDRRGRLAHASDPRVRDRAWLVGTARRALRPRAPTRSRRDECPPRLAGRAL